MDEPARDSSGNLYYGAEFGQIRVRSPKGEWSAIDTGTTAPITAVAINGLTLVAGTQRGEIRVRTNGVWQVVQVPDLGAAVVDLDFVDNRWFVLTAQLKPIAMAAFARGAFSVQNVKLHHASALNFSDLKMLRAVDGNHQWMSVSNPVIRGEGMGHHYYVSTGHSLEQLDVTTSRWTKLDPGHFISIFRISQQTGQLTAMQLAGWLSKLSVSEDGGARWRKVETPPYNVNDIFFENSSTALTSRWNTGVFTANLEFMSFDAKAQNWTKLLTTPTGSCRRTLRDASGRGQLCMSSAGSILRFDGKDLIAEFSAD